MSLKRKNDNRKPSEILRETLGAMAPISLVHDREIIDAMAEGSPPPTIADLLVAKVVRLALDPDKANQWAIELIFDRAEGKAALSAGSDTESRVIDERIENVSVAHLNSLAKRFVDTHGGLPVGSDKNPENGASRPMADSVVGMSGDQAGGSKNA